MGRLDDMFAAVPHVADAHTLHPTVLVQHFGDQSFGQQGESGVVAGGIAEDDVGS